MTVGADVIMNRRREIVSVSTVRTEPNDGIPVSRVLDYANVLLCFFSLPPHFFLFLDLCGRTWLLDKRFDTFFLLSLWW